MNVDSTNPIFVVGYMHSGTTLLLDILSRHTSVFSSRGETKFYDLLPTIKRAYPDIAKEHILREFLVYTAHTILSRSGLNAIGGHFNPEDMGLAEEDVRILLEKARRIQDHGAILPLVFNYLAVRACKARWLEKTPTHIFYIDQILQYAPTVRFVQIVRDPRAVLASKKVRRLSVTLAQIKSEHSPLKRLEKAYDPLWDTLSWKSAIRAGRLASYHHPTKIFTVRYEDLTTRPEISLLEICKFLSLEFEPGMLDVKTKNTAYRAEKDFTGITSKFINHWQTILIPGEVNFPQTLARKEMQALDYEITDTPLSSQLISVGYLLRSYLEFIARSYRRYKLGGWNFLLNVFRNYIHRLVHLFKHSS